MWARLVTVAIGIWLMAAPAVLGYGGALATSDRIVGPTLASFALVAAWPILTGLRWVGFPLSAWMAAAPWLLGGPWLARIAGTLAGLAVLCLTLVPGPTVRAGGGWRGLFSRRSS